MKVEEYINITDYDDFCILKRDESGSLAPFFKINKTFTPLEYLNEKILKAEIETVFVDYDDDGLFQILVKNQIRSDKKC